MQTKNPGVFVVRAVMSYFASRGSRNIYADCGETGALSCIADRGAVDKGTSPRSPPPPLVKGLHLFVVKDLIRRNEEKRDGMAARLIKRRVQGSL